MSAHEHYRRGLGTALRHNQVAYSYSAMVTALFGVLQHDDPGGPNIGQAFLFVLGAATAFAVVNASVTHWFSQRLPREPSEVIALGTAISFFSMAAGLGAGTLVVVFCSPWVAWPVAPLATSMGFMLFAGFEMGLAGFYHAAGGVGGEFDP
jgi:small-conductance mechanosensitive channel